MDVTEIRDPMATRDQLGTQERRVRWVDKETQEKLDRQVQLAGRGLVETQGRWVEWDILAIQGLLDILDPPGLLVLWGE